MGQYLSHSAQHDEVSSIKPEVSTFERNIVIAEVSLIMLALIVFIIFI